jgi:fructose-1,6-bisphosphatase/inositol monophosphatase family enzyme
MTQPLPLTPDTITEALDVVQAAFRHVRPYILERAGKSDYTDKADGSPLTQADIEVEKTLMTAMTQRFPDIPVYGEETGYGSDLPDTFWLIDPIDGTKSFVQNIPAFVNMAVLIQNGEAVASAIYNVSLGDMYVAQKGMGAFKNGTRLDLATTQLPHRAICKGRFNDTLNSILASKNITCEVGPAGGGYGFSKVADGEFAARFNMLGGGYTHDYAPGALLVKEAGGAIIPIKDDEYTYETRSFVACHPDLEALIRPHVAELRALEIQLTSI